MEIILKKKSVNEALEYSELSKSFTSNTHDFHEGGLNAKQRKMFEGKLGEKGIKEFFLEKKINFNEDESSHKYADEYDFIVFGTSQKFLINGRIFFSTKKYSFFKLFLFT